MELLQKAAAFSERSEHTMAAEILEQLAVEGNSLAQIQLANAYLLGRGTAPDTAQAAHRIHAAALGNTPYGLSHREDIIFIEAHS